MKKLFSKIDNSKDPNCFVGKQFVVGRTSVTVEDVIAEGRFKSNNIFISFNTYLNFRWFCCRLPSEKQQQKIRFEASIC